MARGTLVGEAFIRVHADNTAFAREVALGMHGFTDAAGDAGDDAGNEWGQRFFDSLKSELESKMAREFKSGFLSGDFSSFANNFGDVQEALANINTELRTMRDEGGLAEADFADLTRVVERFAAGVKDAEEHSDFGRRAKGMEEYAASLTKAAREMGVLRDGTTSNTVTSDQLVKHMAAMNDQVIKGREGWDGWAAAMTRAAQQMGHLRENARGLTNSLSLRDIEKGSGDWEKFAASMTKAAQEMGFVRDQVRRQSIVWADMSKHMEEAAKTTARTSAEFRRMERDSRTLAQKIRDVDIGSIFGKGSRSEFLNLFGRVVEKISSVTEAMIDLAVKGVGFLFKGFAHVDDLVFGPLLKKLSDMDNALGRGLTSLQEFGAGAAASLGKVGGPIGAIVVVVGTVSSALTAGLLILGEAVAVVTSALSLFAAGVIAAAGAVEVALVGAIGVALPVLFALGAQLAVLSLGFANLSKEQKVIVQPLKDLFNLLQTNVQTALFKDLSSQVRGLGQLISNFLQPLLVGVATGLSQAFTTLLTTLNSASFKPFLTALTTATSSISGSLANALATALPGIIAFFTPILPLAEQLAKSIESVAKTFTDWATSVRGQNSIKEFFTQAWQEAQTLWSIILDVGSALQTLLSVGNDLIGQDFLSFLAGKASELRDFLQSPIGQNELASWFEDARVFGEHLWETLGKIVGALRAMDSPQNREFATKLIIAFGGLADIIKALVPAFEVAGRTISVILSALSFALGLLLFNAANTAFTLGALFNLLGKIPLPQFQWARDFGAQLDILSNSLLNAGNQLVELPKTIDIAFNANPTAVETAAGTAQTAIDGVDKEHTTNFTGNVGGGPGSAPATAQKAALKTVVDQLIPNLFEGVPAEFTTDFKGDFSQLKKDADAVTAELAANATSIDVPVNLDLTEARQLLAHADTELILGADPHFTIPINAETLPLVEDVNKALDKIRAIPPAEILLTIDNKLALQDIAEAETAMLAIPPSRNILITGDNNDLIIKAAEGETALLEHVPPTWLTTMLGDPAPLKSSISISAAALATFDEQWSTTTTAFIGDTAALMDATNVVAPALINSVDDLNTTFFDGNNVGLNAGVASANSAIDRVQDENTTFFKGDVSGLLAKIAIAREQIRALTASFSGALGNADLGGPRTAIGGIFGMGPGGIARGAQVRLIGEDGPEAVVPLRRSLDRVDPSVRALSAFAQGMMPQGGISIAEGAIQVSVPNANPRLVAESVLDRIVARLN